MPRAATAPIAYDDARVQATVRRLGEHLRKFQGSTYSRLAQVLHENRTGPTGYWNPRETQAQAMQERYRERQNAERLARGHADDDWLTRDGVKLLMLAAECPDARLTAQALQLVSRVGQRSQLLDGVRLAAYMCLGDRNLYSGELPSEFRNMSAQMLAAEAALQTRGSGSEVLNHVARILKTKPTSDACVSAARVFSFLGANDTAFAYWWEAMERYESQYMRETGMGNSRLFLLLKPDGTLDAAMALVLSGPRPNEAVDRFSEQVGDSILFRRVKPEGADRMRQQEEMFWADTHDARRWRQRSWHLAFDDLRRSRCLAGMAEALVVRGDLASAQSLALRALWLCEGEYYDELQGVLAAEPSSVLVAGQPHLADLPGDVYRNAARALKVLGDADAAVVAESVSQGRRPDAMLLRRARERLVEAYRLGLTVRTGELPWECAYRLICLDLMQKTGGLPGKGPAAALNEALDALREEVLGMSPKRYLAEGGKPEIVVRRLGVRLEEQAGALAAVLALRCGRAKDADQALERCSHAWASLAHGVGGETFRTSMAGGRTAMLRQLVEALHRAGRHEDALVWTERLRGQALLEVMAGAQPPVSYERAAVQEGLARGAQRCEELSRVLKMDLEGLSAGGDRAAARAGRLTDVVDLAAFRASLPAGTCVLDYWLFDESGMACVIASNRFEVVDLPVGRKNLAAAVRGWRDRLFTGETRGVGGIVPVGSPSSFDPKTDAATRELYKHVVDPVRQIAGTYPHWCIVADGPLRSLSFAALSDGTDTVLDRHTVSYAEGLAFLKQIASMRRPKRLESAVCLGNPDVGDAKYDLPMAQVEAEEVTRQFASGKSFVRSDATFGHLLSSAGDADVLHLACHAVPVDARGNRALWLSREGGRDGYVRYADLYDLKTPAFMAVLSACGTGLGAESEANEVLGLSRGFLAAGIPTLVMSLWDVPDRATTALMTAYYRHLRDHPPAEALRRAQLETRSQFPCPWQWAAFILYGDWACDAAATPSAASGPAAPASTAGETARPAATVRADGPPVVGENPPESRQPAAMDAPQDAPAVPAANPRRKPTTLEDLRRARLERNKEAAGPEAQVAESNSVGRLRSRRSPSRAPAAAPQDAPVQESAAPAPPVPSPAAPPAAPVAPPPPTQSPPAVPAAVAVASPATNLPAPSPEPAKPVPAPSPGARVVAALRLKPVDALTLGASERAARALPAGAERDGILVAVALGRALSVRSTGPLSEAARQLGGGAVGAEALALLNPDRYIHPCATCAGSRVEKRACGNCKGGSCSQCGGSGRVSLRFDRGSAPACPRCQGKGRCPTCGGSGSIQGPCPSCNGRGSVFDPEALKKTYRELLEKLGANAQVATLSAPASARARRHHDG